MPKPENVAEKELLRQVAGGSEQAFRQLFIRYHQWLISHIFRLTGSMVQAEEVAQDVFLKLWMNRKVLAGIHTFRPCLFVLSRNHAVNVLKATIKERVRRQQWELEHDGMKNNSERLSRLFREYYEKTLSREETDELFQLLNRESDDEQLNALIQQAWLQMQEEKPLFTTTNSDIILNSIIEDIHHRRADRLEERLPAKLFTLNRAAIAAIVVLLAGAAWFLFRQTPHAGGTAASLPVVVDTASLSDNN